MRDFNRDRRDDRRDGGRDFKRRDFDRPQEMHKAICSNCGKECEVPFRPTGSKPVFCRECFQNNREGGSGGFQRRDNYNDRREQSNNRPQSSGPNYNDEFRALNTKLDKILNMLTPVVPQQAPKAKKPVAEKEVLLAKAPEDVIEELIGDEVNDVSVPVVKKKKKVKVLPQE